MGHPSSLFDDLEAKFHYLITGPKPLALHGRVLGHGAPKRPIPLKELRALLTEYENWPLHDAVMRELIRRANAPTSGQPWMIAIAWMLLPALRKANGELARGFPGDPADLDAEILAGLINAVRTFGPCGPRIAWHLVDKAQLAARRLRRREARAILGLPPTANRKALHPAWQHPGATHTHPPEPWHDPRYVLDEAVRAGALRPDEARLLTLTQLEGRTLHDIAAESGVAYNTLRQRHLRARNRVRQFLEIEDLEAVQGCR
jgi:DNA-directed RNA polymerase specialized sigma24 family protein